MKTQMNPFNNRLNCFSAIFLQIGLLFSLFIAFIFLEVKSEIPNYKILSSKPIIDETYRFDDFILEKEISKSVEKKVSKPIEIIEKIEKANKEPLKEMVIEIDNKSNKPLTDISNDFIKNESKIEQDHSKINDNIIYKATMYTPVFEGCENLDFKENQQCFQTKMTKYVQKQFDTDIANNIGLSRGIKRIFILFVINKEGEIENIRVRAPHYQLEKEAVKIISSLPKFKPGTKDGKPVNVEYLLPITFSVE